MLTLYRRHLKGCPHTRERFYKRCKACPVWVQGVLKGRPLRKSLQTASWERAEAELKALDPPEPPSVAPIEAERGVLEAYDAFYRAVTHLLLQEHFLTWIPSSTSHSSHY